MKYLDLDVWFSYVSGQDYLIHLRSALGEAQGAVQFFTKAGLEQLGRGLWRFMRPPENPMADRMPGDFYEFSFGGGMFESLMASEEARTFYKDSAAHASKKGMGLRLRFTITLHELTFFPWELLQDGTYSWSFAYSERMPLVRSQLVLPPAPVPERSYPLRILALLDAGQKPSEKGAVVKDRLERTLAPLTEGGLIELHWLPEPTLAGIERALQEGVWDVLYLIQPTDVVQGGIVGAAPDDSEAARGTAELARLVTGHPTLQLVVIHANDSRSTIGACLGDEQVPAVLSLPKKNFGPAGLDIFLDGFFRQLLLGKCLEEAQAVGRAALRKKAPELLQWVAPVLYLQAADGALFNLGKPPRKLPERSAKK